ncbi:MAG TPA: hypothetical protein VIQ78_10975 [Terrimesophilobacter sp.]|uniref:hypothetical protein n=1 Tax=Terrimesophilobacter sp. TaxID=2906435 RepID=UPI002F927F6A
MYSRTLTLATTALSASLLLSGCSLLSSGPPRDDSGAVTESATISARDLQTGDCFTFNSADGGIVAEVTVMPCAQKHDYLVLAQGTLKVSAITAAGSLQNAVSAACSETFTTFKGASTGDVRPKQEFLVFPETDEADSDQLYSCISTDPDQKS